MSLELTQVTPRGAAKAYAIARRSPSLEQGDLLRLAHALANCMAEDEADRFFDLISETGSNDAGADDFVSRKPSTAKPFSGAEDAARPWDRIRHEGSPLPPKAPGRNFERILRRHTDLRRIKFEN